MFAICKLESISWEFNGDSWQNTDTAHETKQRTNKYELTLLCLNRDSPRSVATVVSNLRSKYLSILSEEVEAEETEMDGRRGKTFTVESYAQKSLPAPFHAPPPFPLF